MKRSCGSKCRPNRQGWDCLLSRFDVDVDASTGAWWQCVHGQGGCTAAAPARTVSYTYEKGFLRSVRKRSGNYTSPG